MANKSQSGITDWTNEPETLYFQNGWKTTKKGKKKPQYDIYDPPKGPDATEPGNMGPGGSGTGNQYGTNSYTTGPKPESTGISSTNRSDFGSQIGSDVMNADPNSLAGSIADTQLSIIAADPYAITNSYMMNQGLQSGSQMAGLASNLYNPIAKSYGIMGSEGFSSDAEAINFGEDLLNQFMTGAGQSLNGLQMAETAMVAIADLARDKSGLSNPGVNNVLAGIAAQTNPSEQLNSILGVMEGILKGTMPADSATALLTQMEFIGNEFIAGKAFDMNPLESEKAGKSLINHLLSWMQAKF